MRSIIVSMVLVALTTACSSMPSSGTNNVLVVGGYADGYQISRTQSAFNRTQDALADELQGEGFRVYDETAVGRGADWTSMTDDEVIDQARSVKSPPLDAVVVFSLFADYEGRAYKSAISSRVSGYVLSLPNGQYLGDFDVEMPRAVSIPRRCDLACLSDVVGDQGRELAREAGAVIALKLKALNTGSAKRLKLRSSSHEGLASSYVMAFNGFKGRTLDDIEYRLTRLDGYQHLRLLSSSYRATKYWYESSADEADLLRNVRQLVDDEGISARVTFSRGAFDVTNINRRKARD